MSKAPLVRPAPGSLSWGLASELCRVPQAQRPCTCCARHLGCSLPTVSSETSLTQAQALLPLRAHSHSERRLRCPSPLAGQVGSGGPIRRGLERNPEVRGQPVVSCVSQSLAVGGRVCSFPGRWLSSVGPLRRKASVSPSRRRHHSRSAGGGCTAGNAGSGRAPTASTTPLARGTSADF